MFPNEGYTVKSVKVRWYNQLPQRPSSRWRYQFHIIADYQRLRDGRIVRGIRSYAYKLRKSLNPSNKKEMLAECIEQGMNRCRIENGDDTDEIWELMRIRYRAVIVLRQYKTDRGPRTLKPIEFYRRRKR